MGCAVNLLHPELHGVSLRDGGAGTDLPNRVEHRVLAVLKEGKVKLPSKRELTRQPECLLFTKAGSFAILLGEQKLWFAISLLFTTKPPKEHPAQAESWI